MYTQEYQNWIDGGMIGPAPGGATADSTPVPEVNAGGGIPTQAPQDPGNGLGYGSLAQGFNQPFTGQSVMPATPYDKTFSYTGDDLLNDPGYKFSLKQGLDALLRSKSATGNLYSGKTAKDIEDYAQGVASTGFQQGHDRALTDFNVNKGIFDSNQAGNERAYGRGVGEYQMQHDIYTGNQTDLYNRLAGLSGTGQTAASQLGGAGQNYASQFGQTSLANATRNGDLALGGADAQGGAAIAGANAKSGAFGGIADSLQQLLLMKQLGIF